MLSTWCRIGWPVRSSGVLFSVALAIILLTTVAAQAAPDAEEKAVGRRLAQQAAHAPGGHWTTADHSKFEILQKPFAKAEDVTAACLSCHTMAADQIHHSIHWTWIIPDGDASTRNMGKYGLTLNNFCIAVPSNEPRCTSCHIGFGFKDKNFDFSSKTKIDCIVCHEKLHTYKKFPTKAGYPADKPTVFKGNGKTYQPADWNKLAQSVGLPDRVNCGTCHFNGGGGDGVKHGDLDSSLVKPSKALDVHMNAEGLDFDCQRCHTTKNHQIAGRLYSIPASNDRLSLTEADLASKITCESCHSAHPHKTENKANDHTDRVACQACHIPAFARKKPTKMWWDWSKAGKFKDGKPITEKGSFGKPTYVTKKGEFVWDMNVVPEYRWFNGAMSYLLVTETINPDEIVRVNQPVGSPDDPKSRIMPFKVHRGKQPYDAGRNTMVFPHLFGKKGSGAYWADYDWQKSIQSAMDYVDLPFSGKVGFVETEYYYPTTHMVAPRENTVHCAECHISSSRLAGITGVYMPGRDANGFVDFIGWAMVLGSFVAAALHGLLRVLAYMGRR